MSNQIAFYFWRNWLSTNGHLKKWNQNLKRKNRSIFARILSKYSSNHFISILQVSHYSLNCFLLLAYCNFNLKVGNNYLKYFELKLWLHEKKVSLVSFFTIFFSKSVNGLLQREFPYFGKALSLFDLLIELEKR